VPCDLERLPDEARADVDQDEQADDQRIAPDAGQGARVQRDVLADGQRGRARHEAPDQEVNHADQDQDAQHVAGHPVQIADRAVPQEVQLEQPFERIADVDQHVVQKAPHDEAVHQAGGRPRPEDGALGDQHVQGAPDPPRQLVEGQRSLAAPDDGESLAEKVLGEAQAGDDRQDKEYFLNSRQHRVSSL